MVKLSTQNLKEEYDRITVEIEVKETEIKTLRKRKNALNAVIAVYGEEPEPEAKTRTLPITRKAKGKWDHLTPNDDGVWECLQCDATYDKKQGVVMHMTRSHNGGLAVVS